MERSLQVRVLAIEGSVLVQVDGSVDVGSAHRLRAALTEAIATGGATVEVDLARVTFIGAAGVHCLVEAYREATARALDLYVTAASQPVKRVLGLTGQDHLLRVAVPDAETEDAADIRALRLVQEPDAGDLDASSE